MTDRKPAESKIKRCPPDVKRTFYSCLLRDDYRELLKEECQRLNCSQGVFLELLFKAHLDRGIVTEDEVFTYDSEERRHDMLGT